MSAWAVEVEELVFGFGQTPLFHGLSLQVKTGEIVAILGPDGAGKTTLLRLIVGLYRPWAGRIRLLGHPPHRREAVVGRFGYLPQHFALYLDLSVEENLRLYGRLFRLSDAVMEDRMADLLARTGLAPFRTRRAGALSGGMKKKLGVICNLLHSPQVLFLDEPTTGVDPLSRAELWEFLLAQVVERGMTLVFTTPYIEEAERADRVVLLHEGEVIAEGAPQALRTPVRVFLLRGPLPALRAFSAAYPPERLSWIGNALRLTLLESEPLAPPPSLQVEPLSPTLEDHFLGMLWLRRKRG